MKKNRLLKTSLALLMCTGIAGATVGLQPISHIEVNASGFPDPATIDPNMPNLLKIIKRSSPETDECAASVSSEEGITDYCMGLLENIEGVAFSVTRVNRPTVSEPLDLTTNEGWEEATYYTGNVSVAANKLDQSSERVATTDEFGVAIFDNLPAGLYYVKEIYAEDQYTRIVPFLITLPTAHPLNPQDQWSYEATVQPKNAADRIIKSVIDKGSVLPVEDGVVQGADNTITYTLTSSITDGMTPEEMGEYEITDILKNPAGEEFTNISVSITDGDTNTINLIEGTHYTKQINNDYGAARVTMTPAGVELLANNSEFDVVTELKIKTQGYTSLDDGNIRNQAYFIPNQLWRSQHDGIDGIMSNIVETRYGHKFINKVDSGSGALLEGAEFEVYADENEDGICQIAELVDSNKLDVSETTATPGRYVVDGLQMSDYNNDAAADTPVIYCLVESKAPDGYNLASEPIAFTILFENGESGPASPGSSGDDVDAAINVTNTKINLFNSLPLTGGGGADNVTAGAGLLTLIAGGYFLVANRRKKSEAVRG